MTNGRFVGNSHFHGDQRARLGAVQVIFRQSQPVDRLADHPGDVPDLRRAGQRRRITVPRAVEGEGRPVAAQFQKQRLQAVARCR